MERDELLRRCSPEFREQIKQEEQNAAKEQVLQLERERAATPAAFLQEMKALREDIQALPDRITKALESRIIFAAVVIGVAMMLGDLVRWLYRTFVK